MLNIGCDGISLQNIFISQITNMFLQRVINIIHNLIKNIFKIKSISLPNHF